MRVPGRLVGLPSMPWVYMCSNVVPMGWASAVGAYQSFHRHLVFTPHPGGAALPPEMEWRRDTRTPWDSGAGEQTMYQMYVDGYDNGEKLEHNTAFKLQGTTSEEHERVRESYRRAMYCSTLRRAIQGRSLPTD